MSDNNEMKVMVENAVKEKVIKPVPGMAVLIISLLLMIASIGGFVVSIVNTFIAGCIIAPIIFVLSIIVMCGLKVVNPNEALVLTLFGKYYGTIMDDGFYFVNPFCTAFNPAASKEIDFSSVEDSQKRGKKVNISFSKKVSTKAMTLNNRQQKVNDSQGNPVVIGSVVIWKVMNPTMAVFNVENYDEFLSIQCDSVIRNIARLYPYDNFESEDDEVTLRGSSLEIAEKMRESLQEKVNIAGIDILEIKITHLAYSEEIAAAMLKRQQATATIAAREKIVEGAVGMVQMALEKMENESVVVLDDERKAAMVSNLMVVLCGDRDPQPIINSGSIY